MKLLQKILATEFVWIIAALIFSFPLALISLACVDLMIDDYDEFIVRINNEVILLYLILVVVCFFGVLLMRFMMSAIKVLIASHDEKEENEEE